MKLWERKGGTDADKAPTRTTHGGLALPHTNKHSKSRHFTFDKKRERWDELTFFV